MMRVWIFLAALVLVGCAEQEEPDSITYPIGQAQVQGWVQFRADEQFAQAGWKELTSGQFAEVNDKCLASAIKSLEKQPLIEATPELACRCGSLACGEKQNKTYYFVRALSIQGASGSEHRVISNGTDFATEVGSLGGAQSLELSKSAVLIVAEHRPARVYVEYSLAQ